MARASKPVPDSQRRRLLGRLVAAARERRGLTQREVATLLGKRPSAICDYEVGRREPPGLVLIDLTVVLGIGASDLRGIARAA